MAAAGACPGAPGPTAAAPGARSRNPRPEGPGRARGGGNAGNRGFCTQTGTFRSGESRLPPCSLSLYPRVPLPPGPAPPEQHSRGSRPASAPPPPQGPGPAPPRLYWAGHAHSPQRHAPAGIDHAPSAGMNVHAGHAPLVLATPPPTEAVCTYWSRPLGHAS